jgi:ComF family protein
MGLTQPNLVMAFLRFSKKGDSQKILHQLKYKNRPEIGVELGRIYGNLLKESGFDKEWDQITPVPLHSLKQKRRGYNQSEQFALGISEALNIPIRLCLKRIQFTETQTRKSRMERIENVSNVFVLEENHEVENQKILLVDDVMTTGATLSTCANVLLDGKSKLVDMAVIAAGKS